MRMLAALVLSIAAACSAQTINGSIVGTVVDPSGLAVAGAEVILKLAATGGVRQLRTSERGDFQFASVPPGEYSIAIKAGGFKSVQRNGVNLSASEALPMGEIILEVGSTTETITVTSQGAVVQTASSERSGVITGHQVENIPIRGRNAMSLLSLMPGVVAPNEADSVSRGWAGNVNGNRTDANSLSIDGMGQNQIGASRNLLLSVSQDSVSEVKILLSNYQAEYGRYSGANVQVLTKSGTRDFHGLGSYFKRHEQFNANSFFNNRLSIPKQRYRYNTWTYNIGGPIFLPKLLNRTRDKLFFFWSQEYWPVRTTNSGRQVTMPTELERGGDFSQSTDQNNALIRVTDPTNRQPFANNRIPANRLIASGVAMLKAFPLPNFFDRGISAGRYNYIFNSEGTSPQLLSTLKIDVPLTAKHSFYFSYLTHRDSSTGFSVPASGGPNWNEMNMEYVTDPRQGVIRYQGVYSPTLVNEFFIGANGRKEWHNIEQAEIDRNQRVKNGFTVGQLYPHLNPLDIMPDLTFGGITGAVGRTYDNRIPLYSTRLLVMMTDTIAKTMGAHILKAGINAEREFTSDKGSSLFNGAFDFSRNVNNPLDSNHPFANGLLGVFNTYREATAAPGNTRWATFAEWFGQDNWKVSKRLTLDFGVRFSWFGPRVQRNDLISAFAPDRFDASKMVRLIAPGTSAGRRVGIHPLTGQLFPEAAIGALAPGVGDPANGIAIPAADKTFPRGLYNAPGVNAAPRFGLALDPFGKGKTAIRGGFGIFYNRHDGSSGPFVSRPILETPTIFYGAFDTFRSSTGLLFPIAINAVERNRKDSKSMNMSFSVQHNPGWGTVVDVGYVGTLGRHLQWSRDLNPVPFGANFLSRNADPTNTRVPLPQTFLRPITGYTDINYQEWAGTSNYHSLQVQANRRFTRGVEFGGSWTWSKAMDYADDDGNAVSVLVPIRVWNYGTAGFDRTHVFKLNYVWFLPNAKWRNPALKQILHGWQISGITTFQSGAPLAVGYSFVNAVDITGTASQGARVFVTGNPVLPKSERTFGRFFRTEVFAPPVAGTIGNSARSVLRGPGLNNWDATALKNFDVWERVKLQFRCEFYNTFNHTQFSAVDTAARFDAQGRQINTRMGEFTAARNARLIQMALRLRF
ncbi:MAG: carboxypeptidase regulatory-like domain-containing protein [Candidatus Solibacter usitatus]|nr:carboxypeptidase regulatory-like domain-containing protein [Candidatus Solibacter usitatus]